MPHLRYNGRLWRLSSDELFFPGVFAILGRIFWSTLLITVLAFTSPRLSRCPNGGGLLSYLYLSLTVFILSIFCEACIVKKSLVGSIVENGKREVGIGKYLTAHLALGFLQFILAICGLFVISSRSFIPCVHELKSTQQYDLIMLGVIVISQLVDITSLVCCCYSFAASREGEEYLQDEHYAATMLEGRCKSVMRYIQIVSCNIFGGSNIDEDLNTVARVLTNFFHHDGFLDVVPSDVVAGIMLVRIQQRQRRQIFFNNGISSSFVPSAFPNTFQAAMMHDSKFTDLEEARDDEDGYNGSHLSSMRMSNYSINHRSILDRKNESDRALIESAAKYAKYMIAIYTHLLALYMQPCTGLCCLCVSKMRNISADSSGEGASCCSGWTPSSCSPCMRPGGSRSYSRFQSTATQSSTIKGDNCCRSNHAGLIHFTKDIASEVVYASYENDTVAKPFAVFLNHEQRSVVITIRGSMSLEDCITDAIADPVELRTAGERWGFDGAGRYAHGGFLAAALSIREDLENSRILYKIYEQQQQQPPSSYPANGPHEKIFNNNPYESYELVIVGHSLGAAAAAILALTLRHRYPTVKCLGYGMPASVFDWHTAQECCEYVTSFVLDSDMVARMSVHAMASLREEVLDCIARARVHKLMVLQAVFKDFEPADVMYAKGEEPPSDFRRCVDAYQSSMNRRSGNTTNSDDALPRLHLPGRAVHLVKSEEDGFFCLTRSVHTPHYAPTADFLELTVSPTMAWDHFPDRYLAEVTRLWDSWK